MADDDCAACGNGMGDCVGMELGLDDERPYRHWYVCRECWNSGQASARIKERWYLEQDLKKARTELEQLREELATERSDHEDCHEALAKLEAELQEEEACGGRWHRRAEEAYEVLEALVNVLPSGGIIHPWEKQYRDAKRLLGKL